MQQIHTSSCESAAMAGSADEAATLLRRLSTSELRCVELSSGPLSSFPDTAVGAAINGVQSAVSTISLGLPWLTAECSRRWLGNRIIYWPNGIPQRRRISVVSSRLRLRLDLESWWFDLLRTVILQCDVTTDTVCTVSNSAAFDATVRASALFGRPMLRFHVPAETSLDRDALSTEAELAGWLTRIVEQSTAFARQPQIDQGQCIWEAVVSPECSLATPVKSNVQVGSIPLADRVLFAAASRLHVLSSREGGHVAALLKWHGHDEDRKSIPVLIAADQHGRMPVAVRDLPDGWIPWLVQPIVRDVRTPENASHTREAETRGLQRPVAGRSSVLTATLFSNPSDWLLHWTRPARGPWPGESQSDFLDALILGCESTDRSAMATLLKILSDGILKASSEGIRGGHAVVSFTQVPLSEFRARRVFRQHRQRFDFEPWGVAVHRHTLESLGVRRVCYGDDQQWSLLAPEQQPFFQKATSGGPTDNVAEREWRATSDVNLRSLPPDCLCVFVDSVEAAELVAQHSGQPVVVVPRAE